MATRVSDQRVRTIGGSLYRRGVAMPVGWLLPARSGPRVHVQPAIRPGSGLVGVGPTGQSIKLVDSDQILGLFTEANEWDD